MHLGRFNAAIRDLRQYYAELDLVATIDRAVAQLQPYITNRSASNLAAFRSMLDDAASKARAVPPAFHLPSVTQLYADLGVADWNGARLADQLMSVGQGQGLLPEEMIAQLNDIRAEVVTVTTDVTTLATTLEKRGVEFEELQGDGAEFGIAFPKQLVGESVGQIRAELKHVDQLFSCMNELMGRVEKSPRMRTIASSWWQFFLELDAAQIAFWTVVIERIVHLLKTNYEIKKIVMDLNEKKDLLPDDVIPKIEARVLQNITTGVSELAHDLRAKFQNNNDDARCNELETQLKIELLHLVRKINGGAVLELRLGAPTDRPADGEGEPGAGDDPARVAAHERAVLNEKLADLSRQTATLDLRLDLQLEGPEIEQPPSAD